MRRVKATLTVDLVVEVEDMTPAMIEAVTRRIDYCSDEIKDDPDFHFCRGLQRRLLSALLADEDALGRYLALAVVGEVEPDGRGPLHEALGLGPEGDYAVLAPVIAGMSQRDADYLLENELDGVFELNTGLMRNAFRVAIEGATLDMR